MQMIYSKNELMNGVGHTGRLDGVKEEYLPGMKEWYLSAMSHSGWG